MDRFESLLDQYLNRAAPAETAELERLLQGDAALRRQLADRFLLEVQLYKVFAGVTSSIPAAREDRPARPPVFRWLVAALVLLAVGLGLFFFLGRGPATAANQVLAGDVWVDGVAVQQLSEEKWFEVAAEGPALIRLADGSEAKIAPTSKAVIHGRRDAMRQAVELERGGGNFKVVSGGGQFRVETTLGSVTALGTDFSVNLETRGRDDKRRDDRKRDDKKRPGKKEKLVLAVAVIEGSVKVEAAGKSYVLAAGERRTFSEGGRREEDDDD
jgi:ferric-dicitrate binding protein FerR (iron transport regulator)